MCIYASVKYGCGHTVRSDWKPEMCSQAYVLGRRCEEHRQRRGVTRKQGGVCDACFLLYERRKLNGGIY